MKEKEINNIPVSPLAPSSDEILQYLSENGLIDLSDVRDFITEMNIEKYIMENHSHKVWQNKTDLRWYTYVKDEKTGKRKLVSRKSRKKMAEFLAGYEVKAPENKTIRNLYPEWLSFKRLSLTEPSIERLETDWKKYYENDPIVDVPIGSLNKITLESWILRLISDYDMTKTKYYNASTIIRQIFQYAYDSEIIKDNTFSRVRKDLSKLFRRVDKPADETQVFKDEEINLLETLIWEEFKERGRKVYRLAPLAVLFQLYMGLRSCEVCAVKYSDIQENGTLHVQRMLVKSTGEIRERTKGFDGERTVYIPEKARKIIAATLAYRKDNDISCAEYIFSDTDTPFPERVINDYLERYCKKADIPYRSSHKLRKTAVSALVNSGLSLNAVRAFAGHRDEETTLKYYTFDREGTELRNAQIEKALAFESEKPLFDKADGSIINDNDAPNSRLRSNLIIFHQKI